MIMIFLLMVMTLYINSLAERSPAVKEALTNPSKVYYVGVASNMLKSKILGRSLNKSDPIEIISIQPAVVHNHRLAFNLKGFPPLEPAMGGLEPAEGSQCHGALIELTAENYEKLWKSEGGGRDKPGYDEIVVDAYPYSGSIAVKAIALRAATHVRLRADASPSLRYKSIILEGAKELGLDGDYVSKLEMIPVQKSNVILRSMAMYYFFTISFLLKMRWRWIYESGDES